MRIQKSALLLICPSPSPAITLWYTQHFRCPYPEHSSRLLNRSLSVKSLEYFIIFNPYSSRFSDGKHRFAALFCISLPEAISITTRKDLFIRGHRLCCDKSFTVEHNYPSKTILEGRSATGECSFSLSESNDARSTVDPEHFDSAAGPKWPRLVRAGAVYLMNLKIEFPKNGSGALLDMVPFPSHHL